MLSCHKKSPLTRISSGNSSSNTVNGKPDSSNSIATGSPVSGISAENPNGQSDTGTTGKQQHNITIDSGKIHDLSRPTDVITKKY